MGENPQIEHRASRVGLTLPVPWGAKDTAYVKVERDLPSVYPSDEEVKEGFYKLEQLIQSWADNPKAPAPAGATPKAPTTPTIPPTKPATPVAAKADPEFEAYLDKLPWKQSEKNLARYWISVEQHYPDVAALMNRIAAECDQRGYFHLGGYVYRSESNDQFIGRYPSRPKQTKEVPAQ